MSDSYRIGVRRPKPLDSNSRNFLRIASTVDCDNMHCVVCGNQVQTSTFQVDRYNNVACAHHKLEMCVFCQRIITDGGVDVPFYGHACSDCGAPKSYTMLERVRAFVYDFFTRYKLFIPGCQVKLLSAEQMYKQHADKWGNVPVGTAISHGVGHYEVHLMRNTSEIGMIKTLAHELTHLWQWHRKIDPPASYCEGFCNLVASLCISEINKGEALVRLYSMMEDPDPDYGQAFRELKVVYDVLGWDNVISAMKKYTNKE